MAAAVTLCLTMSRYFALRPSKGATPIYVALIALVFTILLFNFHNHFRTALSIRVWNTIVHPKNRIVRFPVGWRKFVVRLVRSSRLSREPIKSQAARMRSASPSGRGPKG